MTAPLRLLRASHNPHAMPAEFGGSAPFCAGWEAFAAVRVLPERFILESTMRPEKRESGRVQAARAPCPSMTPSSARPADRNAAVESWFARRNWTIFPFQEETSWRANARARFH